MERLTENVLGNIQLKACGNDFCKETCTEHDEEKSCNNCPIQKAFEKLAEYEDLEEQRKLLKLPCAIGDIVYWICGTEILPMEIEYFQILPNKVEFSFKYCGGGGRLKNFTKYMCDSDIGKNVFPTHQEAEAKLKEMEGKK